VLGQVVKGLLNVTRIPSARHAPAAGSIVANPGRRLVWRQVATSPVPVPSIATRLDRPVERIGKGRVGRCDRRVPFVLRSTSCPADGLDGVLNPRADRLERVLVVRFELLFTDHERAFWMIS
jgi:hypothetical protein